MTGKATDSETPEAARDWYAGRGASFEDARLKWLSGQSSDAQEVFKQFRKKMKIVLQDIVRNRKLSSYTDHSIKHSRVIAGILSCLLKHPRLAEAELTDRELWGLLLGTHLHDHRMITGDRSGHERIEREDLVAALPEALLLLEYLEIPFEALQRICALHSRKTGFCGDDLSSSLRTNLLGALLRMADSLDYTAARLPSELFRQGRSFSPETIAEYHKQECVRRIEIDGDAITIHAWFDFGYLDEIQRYLEDDY